MKTGTCKHSAQTRAKMSAKLKGRPKSDAHRLAISKAHVEHHLELDGVFGAFQGSFHPLHRLAISEGLKRYHKQRRHDEAGIREYLARKAAKEIK